MPDDVEIDVTLDEGLTEAATGTPAADAPAADAPQLGFVEGLAADQDFLTLVNQARESGTDTKLDVKTLNADQRLVVAKFMMGLQDDVARGAQGAAAQQAAQSKVLSDAAAARQQAQDEAANVDDYLGDKGLDAFIANLKNTPDPAEIDVLTPEGVTALVDARSKRMAAEVLAAFRAEQLKVRQVRVTAAETTRTAAAKAAREAEIDALIAAEPMFEELKFENEVEEVHKGLSGTRRFERAVEIVKDRRAAAEARAGKEPARRSVRTGSSVTGAPARQFSSQAEEDAFLVGNPDELKKRLDEAKRAAARPR
jgi:hypothetical protein